MHNINHSERLPYEKLVVLGIDREKADSLPQEVNCLLYTSPSPRDISGSRMPSSA